MKRLVMLILALFVLSLCAAAAAKPHQPNHHRPHDKWSHPTYQKHNWRKFDYRPSPFSWYQHRSHYSPHRYRMEYVNDWEWHKRFPGLRAYKWRDDGPGFWYRGQRIRDAVLFYNDNDELVSLGFMHNGLFVFIRDDDRGYDSNDSFFACWWKRW